MVLVATALMSLVVMPASGAEPIPAGLQVPLLSARRVPGLFTVPIADARLRERVGPLLAQAPPQHCLTVTVNGRRPIWVNAGHALEPASLVKLVTATATFHHIRPDEPVTTTVVSSAPPVDGVVAGDIWLVGGGDALLTTPGYQAVLRYPEQSSVSFAQLADAVVAAGITEISGGIIGDESRYDSVRYVATWPERYRGQDTVGPLSALVVNDGVTGFDRTPDQPSAARRPGEPALLAASTLRTLLEARGVRVGGPAGVGVAPPRASELANLRSTYADQVAEMLAWSDNTTAELLTKEIGRRVNSAGTTAAGTRELVAVLDELGLPAAGTVLIDGSGLDAGNRLTCELVDAVLDHAGPASPLAQGLAVAGQTGTLSRRMRGSAVEGAVAAKTGTLATVTSLAGFQRTRHGELITFAFIQNGPGIDTMLQEQLAEVLHDYPDVPDLSDLLPPPLPPTG
jgi:serine-type D-Ala-D-Ala carboxypeptidase/endopeptidase (penicillin-binding protein 4)